MRKSCARSRGFTLIELLVVVAIIALLIAILLPSLGKAGSNARVSACLANMHAVGQASVAYNNIYDGFMVPEQWCTAANNAKPCEWWESIFIHEGLMTVTDFPRDASGVAAAYIPGSLDPTVHKRTPFYCPEESINTYHRVGQSAGTPSPWYDPNKPVVVDTWYELNAQGNQYAPTIGNGKFTSGVTPIFQLYDAAYIQANSTTVQNYDPKINSFDNPQGLILEVEAITINLRNSNSTTAAPPLVSGYDHVGVRWFGPHLDGKVTNIAYVDGHAERHSYKIDATTQLPVGWPGDKSGGKDLHWFSDKTY